jgi:S-adenosylmethionine/arginine decarboxylase-like enzyme
MIYNGKHLTIDGVTDPNFRHALVEPVYGVKFMEAIVHKIDMTMILPPITVNFPHAVSEMHRLLQSLEEEGHGDSKTANEVRNNLKYRVEQAYGYSTFLMIAESHISLHTFPEEGFATFDCYSCKDFDHDAILALWTETFGESTLNVNIVARSIPGKG